MQTRLARRHSPLIIGTWLIRLLPAAVLTSTMAAETGPPIRFAGAPAELVISEVSERTLHLELAPLDDQGRPRPPAPSTVLVPFPTVEKWRGRELAGPRELQIGRLRVTIQPQPLTVSVRRADGKLVQELIFDGGTNGVAFRTDAPVLGLGEGAQQFDRRGALYPMEPTWGGWNRPVLGSVVPSPYLIGTDGWAIFAHRPEGEFDLRDGKGRFIPKKDAQGREPLRLFISSLGEPADALTEYHRLTGRPVLPPKWTMGYFQSHRTLAGPEEPLQIARTFREKQLPCDALIYLGTGYCPAGWNTGHGSLDFNPKTFDRPAENLRALHDLDFKIILHVNRAPRNIFGASITESSDSPLHIRNYWARHHDVFGLGVDGWWPDDGDELPLEPRLTRHRAYYEGPLQDRPNVRPWSLHRTGYAGAQRYGGWIWTGDIDGKWETLAAHVSIGLNHSLSLTPFWGSDTGGFYPTKELTGELYARWFQFSAFCPSFRSHGRTWKLRLPWGWNTGEFGPIEHPRTQHPDLSELHNAEVELIARKYLELRYRLLPYNYSLMREACDSGLPPMRALWLHYSNDAEAVKLGSEYLWGRDLLVAPVTEKGAKVRRVYLPAGNWYDWWTGEKIAGQRWIERPVDLATLPLYARAGSIIPLDPVRQFTAQPVTTPTTLRVNPGADGEFVLYDDDGASLDYQRDLATWTRFRWNDQTRTLTIESDARSKMKPGPPRRFEVTLTPGASRQFVEYAGQRVEAKF
jgi:alpha-glucosidase (family GH31 glycosyl hydrolase)